MPYSSTNSYHTGLGICTFGTDTITCQAKPSWVSGKEGYPTSQEVTCAPVDAFDRVDHQEPNDLYWYRKTAIPEYIVDD